MGVGQNIALWVSSKARTAKGHLFKAGVGHNIALWDLSITRTIKDHLFYTGVRQNTVLWVSPITRNSALLVAVFPVHLTSVFRECSPQRPSILRAPQLAFACCALPLIGIAAWLQVC